MNEVTKQEILAMAPGQELDVLVAQRVMDHPSACIDENHVWRAIREPTPGEAACYAEYGITHRVLGVAEYSTSMNSAWPVLEWLRTFNCDLSLESHGSSWAVHMAQLFDEPMCETAPEAICKAALLFHLQMDPDL